MGLGRSADALPFTVVAPVRCQFSPLRSSFAILARRITAINSPGCAGFTPTLPPELTPLQICLLNTKKYTPFEPPVVAPSAERGLFVIFQGTAQTGPVGIETVDEAGWREQTKDLEEVSCGSVP